MELEEFGKSVDFMIVIQTRPGEHKKKALHTYLIILSIFLTPAISVGVGLGCLQLLTAPPA